MSAYFLTRIVSVEKILGSHVDVVCNIIILGAVHSTFMCLTLMVGYCVECAGLQRLTKVLYT